MGCLSCQVPKTHCSITWTTGQIPMTNKDKVIKTCLKIRRVASTSSSLLTFAMSRTHTVNNNKKKKSTWIHAERKRNSILTCQWDWKQLRWQLLCVPVGCWYSEPQLEPWTQPVAGKQPAGLVLSRPQEPSHRTLDWRSPQPPHAQKKPEALVLPTLSKKQIQVISLGL